MANSHAIAVRPAGATKAATSTKTIGQTRSASVYWIGETRATAGKPLSQSATLFTSTSVTNPMKTAAGMNASQRAKLAISLAPFATAGSSLFALLQADVTADRGGDALSRRRVVVRKDD